MPRAALCAALVASAALAAATSGDEPGMVVLETLVSPHTPEVRVVRDDNANELLLLSHTDAYGFLRQTRMDLADPARPVSPYVQVTAVMDALALDGRPADAPSRALCLGLGGGALPRAHLHLNPAAHVTSIEIDDVMIDVAKRHFRADEPRHDIVHADGYRYVVDAHARGEVFDLVWIDAFGETHTEKQPFPESFLRDDFVSAIRGLSGPTGAGTVVWNLFAKDQNALAIAQRALHDHYDHWLIVIPVWAGNRIMAASNSTSSLTCAAFEAKLEQMRKENPPGFLNMMVNMCADGTGASYQMPREQLREIYATKNKTTPQSDATDSGTIWRALIIGGTVLIAIVGARKVNSGSARQPVPTGKRKDKKKKR